MNNGMGGERVPARSGRLSSGFTRLQVLIFFGVLMALTLAVSGAAAEPAGKAGLNRAVVDEMLGQKSASRVEGFNTASPDERRKKTQTNVRRRSEDGSWAFGTAVIEAPRKKGAYPEGWLFIAKKIGDRWEIGLEGTQTFTELAEEAPQTVVYQGEKETFTASGGYVTSMGISTRLQLPWKRGVRWKMTGGPHGWSTGYDRPYSALDLNGRSRKVRAARGGRVYTMCSNNKGWLRIVHRNGYATDYYHLIRNINLGDGRRIKRGRFLGYTGKDVSCGGAAYGPHVHFGLRRFGHPVTLDRKTIGGWTFHVGKKPYRGSATHKGVRRFPGQYLRNFGPS